MNDNDEANNTEDSQKKIRKNVKQNAGRIDNAKKKSNYMNPSDEKPPRFYVHLICM